jgi:hypothetical protein
MFKYTLCCLSISLMCAATCIFAASETTDAVSSATREHHTTALNITPDTSAAASENANLTADLNRALERQYAMVKAHKLLAYTTAALVLATDIEGTWHFMNMEKLGHQFRDSIDAVSQATSRAFTPAQQAEGIRQAWLNSESQSLRVLHGALVVSSIIAYTSTATIELTIPRLAKDPEGIRMAKLHRNIFYVHAALMAANVALGYAESRALSQGDHDKVAGYGIAHMIIGFSLPVIMVGSGIVFRTQHTQ